MKWCPFCSTLDNPKLYRPQHPCFTVYDDLPRWHA